MSLQGLGQKRNLRQRGVRGARMAGTEPDHIAEVEFDRPGMVIDPATE